MPANLATTYDGKVAMVAMKRIPVWHGTGQRTDDYMTVHEAMELGGLNFPLELRESYWRDQSGTFHRGNGSQVVRTDTNTPLGAVSDKYKVITAEQACDVLSPFIRSGELAGIMTAGVLGRGEQFWCQAAIDAHEVESGNGWKDEAFSTLLVTGDHVGNGKVSFIFGGIYVVCGNTFQMSLDRAAQRAWVEADVNGRAELVVNDGDETPDVRAMSVAHRGDVDTGLKTVAESIDLASRTMKVHVRTARELAAIPVEDSRDVWRLAVKCFAPSDAAVTDWREGGAMRRNYWSGIYSQIAKNYFNGYGADMPSRKGTAFGLWNAVTSFVDYERNPNMKPTQRARVAMFGKGAQAKNDALDICTAAFRDGDRSQLTDPKTEYIIDQLALC